MLLPHSCRDGFPHRSFQSILTGFIEPSMVAIRKYMTLKEGEKDIDIRNGFWK